MLRYTYNVMAAVEVCSVIARETRPNVRKCLSVYCTCMLHLWLWPPRTGHSIFFIKANSKRIKCFSFIYKVACKDGVTYIATCFFCNMFLGSQTFGRIYTLKIMCLRWFSHCGACSTLLGMRFFLWLKLSLHAVYSEWHQSFNDNGTMLLLGKSFFDVCPLQPKIISVLEIDTIFVLHFIDRSWSSRERIPHCIERSFSLQMHYF